MEACSGAHYWGREFSRRGYEVKLIAPQFARPFRKSQKNDAADAEAIAEAASRESMRFVALKTEEQQEVQVLHRVRTRLIKARTALTNEMRGIVAEFGYVMAQGTSALKKWVSTLEETKLSESMKLVLRNLYEELLVVEERVEFYDKKVALVSQSNDLCKRGLTVPGVGPAIATAVFAAIGKGNQFKNGRAFAASLGLVPSQFSTGGKSTLGGISKRGDRYLRQLFVQGARSVVINAHRHTDALSLWVVKLRATKGFNKASVAVANRISRILWAVMAHGSVFEKRLPQVH